MIDRPLKRMADPHVATSRGAALVALVALGRISVADIPRLVSADATFTPLPQNRVVYADLFREFLASYKATRPIFRRLNGPPAASIRSAND